MKINLLYFARLREQFGISEETLELPESHITVTTLLDLLRSRGGAWAAQLSPGQNYRIAVNQELIVETAMLVSGDEVAIFPPVTGG